MGRTVDYGKLGSHKNTTQEDTGDKEYVYRCKDCGKVLGYGDRWCFFPSKHYEKCEPKSK